MLSVNSDNQGFDLLHEIGKEGTYNLLFPESAVGFAILQLYQKVKSGVFQNGRFTEADISAALEASRFINRGEGYDRLPHLKFNDIINDLQVYFLRFDTDEQLYTLKDYGESFCRHAEETLLANFSPTKIEEICNDLRIKLESCHDQFAIYKWIDTYFLAFKPAMKSQVDRLERQIDNSVQEIRHTTQVADVSILDVLKRIDNQLDLLRSQNEELRSAFREMKTINLILGDRIIDVTDSNIADSIADVRRFFPEIKYTLNLIDKRLDRIQPKLRQFFGMLNKPSFNVKSEEFLKFLLTKSTVDLQKNVILPEGIPVFDFHQQTIKFTIFERREDIFPTKPKVRIRPSESLEEKEKGLTPAKNQLKMYNKIDNWLAEILKNAKQEERIFSTYFFEIINSESGDIELALNVAYALIRKSETDRNLILNVIKKRIKHPKHNVSVWEMKINYKK